MKPIREHMTELVRDLSTAEIKHLAGRNFRLLWTWLCAEALEARMFSSSSRYGKQVISQ